MFFLLFFAYFNHIEFNAWLFYLRNQHYNQFGLLIICSHSMFLSMCSLSLSLSFSNQWWSGSEWIAFKHTHTHTPTNLLIGLLVQQANDLQSWRIWVCVCMCGVGKILYKCEIYLYMWEKSRKICDKEIFDFQKQRKRRTDSGLRTNDKHTIE